MHNKYLRLFQNSIAFMLGNLGSKLITFVMLPLYTYKLSTSEFGVTDLVQTTVNLLLPICFLSVSDAVLRFTMDRQENDKEIFTNGCITTALATIAIFVFSIIVNAMGVKYVFYVAGILFLQGLQSLLSQFSKAIGHVKVFAVNGTLLTLITAISNLCLLLWLNLGVAGFFWSILIGLIVSNLYLMLRLNLWKYFDLSLFRPSKLQQMFQYSIPMISNAIAWWSTSEINRYYILYLLGTAANGIFAVSNKLPSVVSLVTSIFFQSWQISAIEEFDSKDKDTFYSDIFNMYLSVIFLTVGGMIAVLKPILHVLVSPQFFIAWKYVPFLLVSVMYSSFASFLGQNYVAAKKTKNILWTTIWGSIINLLLNLVLSPFLGLQGVCISSAVSFFTVWVYRQYDTRKFVTLAINYKKIILNHIVLAGQISCLYFFLAGKL